MPSRIAKHLLKRPEQKKLMTFSPTVVTVNSPTPRFATIAGVRQPILCANGT